MCARFILSCLIIMTYYLYRKYNRIAVQSLYSHEYFGTFNEEFPINALNKSGIHFHLEIDLIGSKMNQIVLLNYETWLLKQN